MKLKMFSTFAGILFLTTPALASPEITDYEVRQRHCLAEAILFEAGNQPIVGKIAVGEVIMNRVASNKYPNTICDVVHQGKYNKWWKRKYNKLVPIRNKCQFSYYCDGRSDRTDRWARTETWRDVITAIIYVLAADTLLSGFNVTNGATHYHATYVTPAWSKYLIFTVRIQDHKFYK